jgi:hypothetical protein
MKEDTGLLRTQVRVPPPPTSEALAKMKEDTGLLRTQVRVPFLPRARWLPAVACSRCVLAGSLLGTIVYRTPRSPECHRRHTKAHPLCAPPTDSHSIQLSESKRRRVLTPPWLPA